MGGGRGKGGPKNPRFPPPVFGGGGGVGHFPRWEKRSGQKNGFLGGVPGFGGGGGISRGPDRGGGGGGGGGGGRWVFFSGGGGERRGPFFGPGSPTGFFLPGFSIFGGGGGGGGPFVGFRLFFFSPRVSGGAPGGAR